MKKRFDPKVLKAVALLLSYPTATTVAALP
jgi:hypothetical protein